MCRVCSHLDPAGARCAGLRSRDNDGHRAAVAALWASRESACKCCPCTFADRPVPSRIPRRPLLRVWFSRGSISCCGEAGDCAPERLWAGRQQPPVAQPSLCCPRLTPRAFPPLPSHPPSSRGEGTVGQRDGDPVCRTSTAASCTVVLFHYSCFNLLPSLVCQWNLITAVGLGTDLMCRGFSISRGSSVRGAPDLLSLVWWWESRPTVLRGGSAVSAVPGFPCAPGKVNSPSWNPASPLSGLSLRSCKDQGFLPCGPIFPFHIRG